MAKKPDEELTVHYPNIKEAWFKAYLEIAAGEAHGAHYNKWAAEKLGISEAVLTRRLKGRKKWPAEFVGAVAKLIDVDAGEVIRNLGSPAKKRAK